jgi:hypothetical protein
VKPYASLTKCIWTLMAGAPEQSCPTIIILYLTLLTTKFAIRYPFMRVKYSNLHDQKDNVNVVLTEKRFPFPASCIQIPDSVRNTTRWMPSSYQPRGLVRSTWFRYVSHVGTCIGECSEAARSSFSTSCKVLICVSGVSNQ